MFIFALETKQQEHILNYFSLWFLGLHRCTDHICMKIVEKKVSQLPAAISMEQRCGEPWLAAKWRGLLPPYVHAFTSAFSCRRNNKHKTVTSVCWRSVDTISVFVLKFPTWWTPNSDITNPKLWPWNHKKSELLVLYLGNEITGQF